MTFSLRAHFNLFVTRMRYVGASLRARSVDPARLAAFRASEKTAIFTIIGPGASLNDLDQTELASLKQGCTISINLAALAPMDFDICSTEAFVAETDYRQFDAALRKKSRLPLIWHQNRRVHDNEFLDLLERDFGLYRYRRVSVSVRRDVQSFQLAFDRLIGPRVFDNPDLRLSFAMCGSVARAVLLGLSLGYRHIRFVGVDLGSTPYFWLEDKSVGDAALKQHLSHDYQVASTGAIGQGSHGVVPNLFEFLETVAAYSADVRFSVLDPRRRSRLTPFLGSLKNAQGEGVWQENGDG